MGLEAGSSLSLLAPLAFGETHILILSLAFQTLGMLLQLFWSSPPCSPPPLFLAPVFVQVISSPWSPLPSQSHMASYAHSSCLSLHVNFLRAEPSQVP